jgi:hypothetical protein
LEDEFGGALGQGEVAEFIEAEELDAGVAGDDAVELAARLGFLEFVGEGGEGGEADAAALLAGADGERDREDASMSVKRRSLRDSCSFGS